MDNWKKFGIGHWINREYGGYVKIVDVSTMEQNIFEVRIGRSWAHGRKKDITKRIIGSESKAITKAIKLAKSWMNRHPKG